MNEKLENQYISNSFSHLPKSEKTKVLLKYARECYKKGYKPTKRGIRKKFHVEIYNYFKNIADYHRKADIPVSLRHRRKEKARTIMINYIKKEAQIKRYPDLREIEKKFKVHFTCYFKTLNELYKYADVDLSLVREARKLARMHSKRVLRKQRENIKELIQKKVRKGIYPGSHYIQRELNLSFYNLYDNIRQAYNDAGVDYERPSPILLGKEKEKVFTKIVKNLLLKMGYKIKRISIESKLNFNKGPDMIIEDSESKTYFVEIKAYRKDYSISKRELQQLANYIDEGNTHRGVFITTSVSKKCDFDNILFVNGDKVIELLKSYKLARYIDLVQWIQRARVNSEERERYKEKMKQKIINYARAKNITPTKTEIERTFKIDIRSYFGNKNPYQKLLEEIN